MKEENSRRPEKLAICFRIITTDTNKYNNENKQTTNAQFKFINEWRKNEKLY